MYKRFLRSGFRAIENKYPQKYILQKVLRERFEIPSNATQEQINNTLSFFRAAAETDGLERRCVFTLLHYYASRHNQVQRPRKNTPENKFNEDFMNTIIRGVNETQNMCL